MYTTHSDSQSEASTQCAESDTFVDVTGTPSDNHESTQSDMDIPEMYIFFTNTTVHTLYSLS